MKITKLHIQLFFSLGKCMYLSGLLPRPMCSDDDKKLLDFGIGFTNIVERTTRGSANLSRQEIVEGIKEQRLSRLLNFDSPSLRWERGGHHHLSQELQCFLLRLKKI